jgi:arylsulfatase A-like enzyme
VVRVLLLSCALVLAWVSGCAEEEEVAEAPTPARPPHVVLIVADTLRQDYLGFYGFDGPVSPALDRFARDAVVFDDAISAAPWTKPSMVSMMTALPPERHGLVSEAGTGTNGGQTQVLRSDVPVLATALRNAGYRTVALYANPWLKPGSGLDRGFDQYTFVRRPGHRISEQAVQLLAGADRPLFLYLHYLDPHGPYRCGAEDERLLADSASLGDDRALASGEARLLGYLTQTRLTPTRLTPTRPTRAERDDDPPTSPEHENASQDDESARGVAFYRRCYAAGIRAFDAVLAPVLAQLSSAPRSEDTVVLFTSDHGEGLGEHAASPTNRKGWEHGWSLHHHQLRVPLLIRLPGGEYGGRRVRGVVSGLDVAPTLLDLAGVRPWPDVVGHSLRPLIEGRGTPPPETRFASGVKGRPGWIAVRDGRYKLLIATDSNTVALYDLDQDPGETRDLAESMPDRTSEMRSLARERLLSLLAAPEPDVETRPTDPETLEQLRALGYLEDDAGNP